MSTATEVPTEVKKVVKSTVPILRKRGTEVVTRFYSLLFERHPELKKQFNMDRQPKGRTQTDGVPAQVLALSNAVLAYANNIDRIDVLKPKIMGIAHKHVSRGVEPLQYNAIGECLIAAMQDILGGIATKDVIDAWVVAYGALAQVFIDVERELTEQADTAAGYHGFKSMTVREITRDEDGGVVIDVVPADGPIPRHAAGQYVAIEITDVEEIGETMLTAFIDETSADRLRLRVPANGEAANEHVIATVVVGAWLQVGVPCGVPRA